MNTPRSPLPPLLDVFAGKHLVVTGVTGFVGKVWLAHVLAHLSDVGRVTLLVRPPRRGTALERFAEIAETSPVFRPLRASLGDDLAAFLDARVEVLDADVSKPMCGLDDATVDRLAASADAVVHIAGLTDFQPDPKMALAANTDGAMHVADLAARMAVPRMVHVSTCFVTGRRDGAVEERLERGVAPSGDVFDPQAEYEAAMVEVTAHPRPAARVEAVAERADALGFPNIYTYSKGLAEHLLAARDDVSVTIFRPTVVECARTFPFAGWNEGLNTSAPIMWFCASAFPHLPCNGDMRFDVVPVDTVARALTAITARHLQGDALPVYQCGTSDHNPVTLHRVIELNSLAKRRHGGGRDLRDRLIAHLDAAAAAPTELGLADPARLARWSGEVAERLSKPMASEHPVARWLRGPLKTARNKALRTKRDMARLARMLEVYQPFIHDHDWVFRTENTRAELAALHPDDREVFSDDTATMCWRTYWMDVQFVGVKRWSFPIMDGQRVGGDAPGAERLVLQGASGPLAVPETSAQGAA